jgi:ribosomal protein S18 acetylase RimI-like enzyme
MPLIEIEKIRPEHLARLKEFFREIDAPDYRKDFSPHPFDAEQAMRICNYGGRDLYFAILMDRKEMVGYGMLRGWDEGYEVPAIGLCILKKYQGIGLGKLLLNFLETVSRLAGSSKTMLKVKKDNVAAKGLYESQQYVFKEYNEEFLIGFKKLPR